MLWPSGPLVPCEKKFEICRDQKSLEGMQKEVRKKKKGDTKQRQFQITNRKNKKRKERLSKTNDDKQDNRKIQVIKHQQKRKTRPHTTSIVFIHSLRLSKYHVSKNHSIILEKSHSIIGS